MFFVPFTRLCPPANVPSVETLANRGEDMGASLQGLERAPGKPVGTPSGHRRRAAAAHEFGLARPAVAVLTRADRMEFQRVRFPRKPGH